MNQYWSPPSQEPTLSRESGDDRGVASLGGPNSLLEEERGGFLRCASPAEFRRKDRGEGQEDQTLCRS